MKKTKNTGSAHLCNKIQAGDRILFVSGYTRKSSSSNLADLRLLKGPEAHKETANVLTVSKNLKP